ncbi:MAG: nucleotide sugar dehydrogenase [Alistipes sp.]|nr:nucleotide sugar dehydrogenase [Alistipes sp.]
MRWSETIYARLTGKEQGRASVAVVGLGYVGLPLALAFSRCFRVVGYDTDPRRIAQLRDGIDASGSFGADDFRGRDILFTASGEALADAAFYIVAVPTPVDAGRRPDLSCLDEATRTVGRCLRPGDCVVFESTVWPGCTEERCVPLLESVSGLVAGRDFKVGYSPERINPGDREHTLSRTVKVVAGCDAETLDGVAAVYGRVIGAGVFRAASIRVAEAAKMLENVQRDVNIALMNECAVLFRELGIDTAATLEAAATKWNFMRVAPGLVGGHCIGVDPYYLLEKAAGTGVRIPVVQSARAVNEGMVGYVARALLDELRAGDASISPPLAGWRVLQLGITYKENVADCRNSKAAELFGELTRAGVEVDAADPCADAARVREMYGIELAERLRPPYDLVLVAVPHDAYRSLDEEYFLSIVKPGGCVADLRSIYRDKIRTLRYWSL